MYYLTNNFTDVVIADSEAVADNLYDRYGDTVNIQTVPIAGVDTTRFEPSTTTGGRDVSVGILGSLTEQKNHVQVIKVAERLPDVMFHIGGVGPKREILEAMVDDKSLTNIHFHGYVDDVPAFLSERDIYFQPSHFEGLCITVIEAMACGLPVVASEVGGIKNSVKPGKTGFLAPADETDAFVGYIQRLRENPKMRNQFGRIGRKRVKLKYSTSVLTKRFNSVINTA
jgi:glycosyltransferase involved in cell wall biosynthesis